MSRTAYSRRLLADRSWPEVRGCQTVLVPVGSLEQHGPHLPLDTDTVIAEEAVAAAADLLAETDVHVLLAPAISYGASGEHQSFPGTVSLGHDALRLVLIELVRSMTTWVGRVVLVNGHGGNTPTVMWACRQLRAEGHDVAWVPCFFEPDGDVHAGDDETSLMLHLDPTRVRMGRAEPGNTAPLAQLMPAMRSGGLAAVTANGVLGDPTAATAERGETLFRKLVTFISRAVVVGQPDGAGRLRVCEPADA